VLLCLIDERLDLTFASHNSRWEYGFQEASTTTQPSVVARSSVYGSLK